MHMKRRKFIQSAGVATGMGFFLNGFPLRVMGKADTLSHAASQSTNDNILVIIQMHGGNDGLNTLVPINGYDTYYNLRPNIAIPDSGKRKYITLDNTVPENKLTGLHPDMRGLKALYDEGKVAIVQNSGYENMNGSHFKGRDIWFGGVGYNDPINSGWIGRYLLMEFEKTGKKYPEDFPNAETPYPLGLEFSNEVSLGFHTESTIPTGLSIPNPATFFDLVNELPGFNDEIKIDPRGIPPEAIKNSLYGQELTWILDIEQGTDKYAEILQKAYRTGDAIKTGVRYPTLYPLAAPTGSLRNPLAGNLNIISKLISGGCSTKVYLVRIGGFDTHVNQVESYDNTLGSHAALLYHFSSAVKAFQDDLKARGIEDKVLTITMSEFGRRALSNTSYGSDHGSVAPLFAIGSRVNPGMIGQNPDMPKAVASGNLSDAKQDIIDYRLVFNTIVQEWFGLTPEKSKQIFPTLSETPTTDLFTPDIYDKLPLFKKETNVGEGGRVEFRLLGNTPNPVISTTQVEFYVAKPSEVTLALTDAKGVFLFRKALNISEAGYHYYTIDMGNYQSGIYFYSIHNGEVLLKSKLVKL